MIQYKKYLKYVFYIQSMRVCILFRGENIRFTRGTMVSLDNIANWEKYLYGPLICEGHSVDTTLVTYESEIIGALSQALNVRDLVLEPKISQVENMKHVVNYMKEKKEEYDRFLILRFDFIYRIPVIEWPKWNESGILLTNRDEHWCREHLYHDGIFVVDSPMVDSFHYSVHQLPPGRLPHDCGRFFYDNDIPFHLMYNDFFPFTKNPLYALANGSVLDPGPSYEPMTDISMSIGISPLTLASIIIDSEEIFDTKRKEIDFLANQYDIIDFKCSFPEKVREVYNGKKYIFETIKVSQVEIDLKSYEIV
jgi:hypothetical protein